MKIVNTKPNLDIHSVIQGVIFDPRDFMSKYPQFKERQDPIYMCDLTSPGALNIVVATCYHIDKKSMEIYKHSNFTLQDVSELTKAHTLIYEYNEPFGKYPVTRLSRLAKQLYDKHKHGGYINKIDPPIFSSIISEGKDSITHQQCRVISERLQTRPHYNAKKHTSKLEPGPLTHVKIGMTNFYPIRKCIPNKVLLHELTAQDNSILGMYLGF